jgi:hypothetical protein
VSHYISGDADRPSAAEILAELGYQVAGQSRPPANDPDIPSRTAWIIAR